MKNVMDKYDRIIGDMMEDNIPVYYYEDKPYRVLHEGKVKSLSILLAIDRLIVEDNNQLIQDDIVELNEQLAEHNAKWIDVVIYEPLYEECDIRVCVKEKEDFYNNYKPKINESKS